MSILDVWLAVSASAWLRGQKKVKKSFLPKAHEDYMRKQEKEAEEIEYVDEDEIKKRINELLKDK